MSKERLTYYGTPQMTEEGMTISKYSDYSMKEIINKLADYEDLEEQGLLLRLPCKVGDDIYYILGVPEVACCIEKAPFELWDINRIGKDLFLTRLEAEEKLRELEGKR